MRATDQQKITRLAHRVHVRRTGARGRRPLEVTDARPIGARRAVARAWHRDRVGEGGRRPAVHDRGGAVLFALVGNRAIAPMSKLSAAGWAFEDVVIPRLAGMDTDRALPG